MDSYINENCYSSDFTIITNKNTIILSLKCFYENPDSLFDELTIYAFDSNTELFEIPLNKNHTHDIILETLLSFLNID